MNHSNTHIEPLISPDQFVGLEGVTHLCTGGEAPWLKAQEAVYMEFARLKSAGHDGREEIYARGERCRSRMGELWRVPSDRIAFMPSAAEGMNWLAPWSGLAGRRQRSNNQFGVPIGRLRLAGSSRPRGGGAIGATSGLACAREGSLRCGG